MARIQEKLSQLVAQQLPEFVRSDYTTFKAFIEAYYRFLEQDQGSQELLQNARSYRDIDTTISSFIEYFVKEYASSIPRDLIGNKKLLVKKINDLYTAKGSVTGYKLLFQLLYGKQVDIFYPSEFILKPSSGQWIQSTSFFIEVIYGDVDLIDNKIAKLISTNKQIEIKVLSKNQTTIIRNGQTLTTTSNVYEVFFDNSSAPRIQSGDILVTQGFRGRVLSIPTISSIIQPGTGFKVGDILDIEVGDGIGVRLKVTSVDSNGGIKNLQFLAFGVNYPSVFNVNLSSVELVEQFFFEKIGDNITLRDKITGLEDYGTINKFDYAVDAFDAAYCGQILGTFSYSPEVTASVTPGSVAIVQFASNDTVVNYPGYYRTTDGFLSDEYKLEDADYYQPYSYVVRIDEQLKNYRNVILQLLHPAGTKLHGDYRITNSIDVLTEVMTIIGFVLNDFQDTFSVVDDGATLSVSKPVSEELSLLEVYTTAIDKQLANVVVLEETTVLDVTKPLANTIVLEEVYVADVIKPLAFSGFAVDYFIETIEDPYAEGSEDFVLLSDTVEIIHTVGP